MVKRFEVEDMDVAWRALLIERFDNAFRSLTRFYLGAVEKLGNNYFPALSGRAEYWAYRTSCSRLRLPKFSLSGGAAHRKNVPTTTS